MSEDGSCLASHTPATATRSGDQALDKYQDMYPNAFVDIYSKADLQGLVSPPQRLRLLLADPSTTCSPTGNPDVMTIQSTTATKARPCNSLR